MSRSIRIFDDEIIAKKVFTKIENASKLPLNYINKNRDKYTKDIKTGKLISKNMFRKNTEVVVKITSGSKNSQALSKHLDYISRDGNVELITNDFDRYAGEDEILEVKRIFKNEGAPIPLYKEGAKEKRHTINMVFSMKEHSTTPKEKENKERIYKKFSSALFKDFEINEDFKNEFNLLVEKFDCKNTKNILDKINNLYDFNHRNDKIDTAKKQ